MKIKTKAIKLVITALIISLGGIAYAQDYYDNSNLANPIAPDMSIRPDSAYSSVPQKATLTKNNIKTQYNIAFDRFVQSNVKASYDNYEVLILTIESSDYAYMALAEKMATLGFFDLSELSSSRISDKEYSKFFIDDVQRYYFPSKKLKKADEIYLAEVYSNIMYNDQSKEATAELVKNTDLIANSDYANYVVALGYLKSNDIEHAMHYINSAIAFNQDNLNYKRLKAEILAQGKHSKEALSIVEYLRKQSLYSLNYTNKILSLEQYILYKTAKKEADKNYHLGYYYYLEGEQAKAVRTLQGTIVNKKKVPKGVYSLLAKVYFDLHEYEKALDMAGKSQKIEGSNSMALIVLGDLSSRDKDYKNALKYYKDAADKDKKSPDGLVKLAQIYQKTGATKKALEIYSKILKTYTNCYIAYYEIALSDKSKEYDYLRKSVAINSNFKDGWIDLAKLEIEQHNFDKAKQHLAIAYYIDENDFRYYYYQGKLLKAQGLKNEAQYNFKKSVLLNPDYQPAKEELSI